MLAAGLTSHCADTWQLDVSFGTLCLATAVTAVILPDPVNHLPRSGDDVRAMMTVNHVKEVSKWFLDKVLLLAKEKPRDQEAASDDAKSEVKNDSGVKRTDL